MRVLLDTHALIWFRAAPDRLGRVARAMLSRQDREFSISAVTALEVAQLIFSGRVSLAVDLDGWMRESFRLFGCGETPVTTEIAIEAYRLPGEFHADPADRLLVATARLHNWSLLTADRRLLDYPHVSTVAADR